MLLGQFTAGGDCFIMEETEQQTAGEPATDAQAAASEVSQIIATCGPGDEQLCVRQLKRRQPRCRSVAGAGAMLSGWWRAIPPALRSVLLVLLGIIATSMLLFHYVLGLRFVDAFYFVISIVTTTGFGDYNLMNAPDGLKIYGALLMLSGGALIATIFSIVTDVMLRARLRHLLVRSSATAIM